MLKADYAHKIRLIWPAKLLFQGWADGWLEKTGKNANSVQLGLGLSLAKRKRRIQR